MRRRTRPAWREAIFAPTADAYDGGGPGAGGANAEVTVGAALYACMKAADAAAVSAAAAASAAELAFAASLAALNAQLRDQHPITLTSINTIVGIIFDWCYLVFS